MSSITGLLARNCKQRAVYWGSPVEDGQGGKTFAAPVEIACRWEEMNQIVSDAKGSELTSRAVVYVLQDVDEEGFLYLGDLLDVTGYDTVYVLFDYNSVQIRKGVRGGIFVVDKAITPLGFGTGAVEGVDWVTIKGDVVSTSVTVGGSSAPKDKDGAYTIKRFQKIPALGSTTEFLRKAYLTPSLSFGGF
jgi:hypothetical protein